MCLLSSVMYTTLHVHAITQCSISHSYVSDYYYKITVSVQLLQI